jgi:hypothetical protein
MFREVKIEERKEQFMEEITRSDIGFSFENTSLEAKHFPKQNAALS